MDKDDEDKKEEDKEEEIFFLKKSQNDPIYQRAKFGEARPMGTS